MKIRFWLSEKTDVDGNTPTVVIEGDDEKKICDSLNSLFEDDKKDKKRWFKKQIIKDDKRGN